MAARKAEDRLPRRGSPTNGGGREDFGGSPPKQYGADFRSVADRRYRGRLSDGLFGRLRAGSNRRYRGRRHSKGAFLRNEANFFEGEAVRISLWGWDLERLNQVLALGSLGRE